MLREKIFTKSIKVGILGLGYVGLPLALLCVEKGYSTVGIDIDQRKINVIKEGKSYISEISDAQLQTVYMSGELEIEANFDCLPQCDIIVICVPTPLKDGTIPDYSYLMDALEAVAETLRHGQLIIIESTMVPQTTRNEVLPVLEKTGLKIGKDFYLSCSPERIDPGNLKYQLETIPKLVAGVTTECRELAELFYKSLDIKTFSVENTDVAEMAKILENTYRYVNIALINEMAVVCGERGLNIWDVIAAASSKPFGFQAFFPGPGVGGHCIPKDSSFYSYWTQMGGGAASLVQNARRINDGMPQYIVSRIEKLLCSKEKAVENCRMLVLGITYKKNVNDIRDSAAIKIMKILKYKGALLSYHDPYIMKANVDGQTFESLNFDDIKGNKFDFILMAVAHDFYKGYRGYNGDIVFDLTNTLDKDIPGLYHL